MKKKTALAWPDDPKALMKDAEKWNARKRLIDKRDGLIEFIENTWLAFLIGFGIWPIVIGWTVNIIFFSAGTMGFVLCPFPALVVVFVLIVFIVEIGKIGSTQKRTEQLLDLIFLAPFSLPIAYTWYICARFWNWMKPKKIENKSAVMRKYLAVQLKEQQKRVQGCEQLKNLETQIEEQLERTRKFKEQFKLRLKQVPSKGHEAWKPLLQAQFSAEEREKKLEEARDKLKTYRAKTTVFFEEAEKSLGEEGLFGDLELIEEFIKEGSTANKLEVETDRYIDQALMQMMGEMNKCQKVLESAGLESGVRVAIEANGSRGAEEVVKNIEEITEQLLNAVPQMPKISLE